ncbi:MAG: hypothetical protein IJJ17_02260 [Parasporobacterium sp.]|nr:hypothetical protein [Parasporobacterium sp.]
MTYQEFVNDVKKRVTEKTAARNARVTIMQMVKANDRVRDGLLIVENERDPSPTIYLDDLYEWHQEGISQEEIAEQILQIHDSHKNMPLPPFPDFRSFEKAKHSITCKLFNTKVNEKYLEDAATIEFFDLSVAFYCTAVVGREKHVFSSKVTEEMLEQWGKTTRDLFPLAMSNTAGMLGVYLKEVKEVFLEMADLQEEKDILQDALEDGERSPMYLLSNEPRRFGAVNMLQYELLQDLSEELEDDLYIIPSSIHEVLLVPVHSRLSREEADAMVRDVNRNILGTEDILSDHVYLYSRLENRITA